MLILEMDSVFQANVEKSITVKVTEYKASHLSMSVKCTSSSAVGIFSAWDIEDVSYISRFSTHALENLLCNNG